MAPGSLENEVRNFMEARAIAVREKNVDRAILNFADDVVIFDVVNPLQYKGANAARKRTEEWFASFEGAIRYNYAEIKISSNADTAFAHHLNHVNAKTKTGDTLDMWWRATICYQKIDGKLKVVHEHNSVPFSSQSGKASLDLKP